MRILFVCKENKNNDFIQQFLLFRVSLHLQSYLFKPEYTDDELR